MYNGKENKSELFIRAWWTDNVMTDIHIEMVKGDIARDFDVGTPDEEGISYTTGEKRWFVQYPYNLDILEHLLTNKNWYGIQEIEVRA